MADTPPAAPPGPPRPPHPQAPPRAPRPQPQPQPHQKRRPPPPRPPARQDDGPLQHGSAPHGGDGSGPGGTRRRPDPADRERAAVAARRSNLFVLLALAALVTASLPLPWGIVAGTGFGVAALVVGLMAVIAAMDARLPGGRVAVLWVSLAVVAVVVLLQLGRVVLYPRLVENQDCQREAITLTAQEACAQRSGLPTP